MAFQYAGTPGLATVQGGQPIYVTPQGSLTSTSPNAGALGSGDPSTFDWSSILGNLIAGGANLFTMNQPKTAGQQAAAVADPFASQRGQYQTGLNTFMGNPSNAPSAALAPLMNLINNPQSITNVPGYQFGMTQGLEAVNRGAGASGLLNSGNRLAALQNFGQNYAGSWLDRIFGEDTTAAQLGLSAQGQGFNQLAQLAGVNAGSPAAAGSFLMQGATGTQQNLAGGISGLLAALTGGQGGGILGAGLKGLSDLFGGGGTDLSQLSPDDLNALLGGGSATNPGGFDLTGLIPGIDNTGGLSDLGGDFSGLFGGGLGP